MLTMTNDFQVQLNMFLLKKCQRIKSQDVSTATWNVSSMVSRSGEVVDALHRRKIDFCCAQETRWKGESVRMLGANGSRNKLFWQGCNK